MNKMFIFISILILQNTYAKYTNEDKCNLIIKSIFSGLGFSNQIKQINFMDNLDCDGFLQDISKSVEFSNNNNLGSLQIGWDELGNALGKFQESITKYIKQNENFSQFQWMIKYTNNIKLKLKNNIICEQDEQQTKLNELLFRSNFFSDQFKSFNEEQYEQYGYQIGQMLFKLQFKINNISSIFQDTEVALKVFSGLQFGIKDQSLINRDQLEKCLEGADQIVIYFDDFSVQIQNSLQLLFPYCVNKQIQLAMKLYVNSLKKCSDSITNAPVLINRIENIMASLDNQPQRITRQLLKLKQVQSASICWELGYWFGFGEELGIYLWTIESIFQFNIINIPINI